MSPPSCSRSWFAVHRPLPPFSSNCDFQIFSSIPNISAFWWVLNVMALLSFLFALSFWQEPCILWLGRPAKGLDHSITIWASLLRQRGLSAGVCPYDRSDAILIVSQDTPFVCEFITVPSIFLANGPLLSTARLNFYIFVLMRNQSIVSCCLSRLLNWLMSGSCRSQPPTICSGVRSDYQKTHIFRYFLFAHIFSFLIILCG